ncbi:MAG: TerC/Alx family metal homeostasis membrane protein [Bacteroidales bacterium]
MSTDTVLYIFLAILMAGSLFVDFWGHRDGHTMSLKEAIKWSLVWVAVSIVFGLMVLVTKGADAGAAFFSGYILEKALSVDNLMVFTAIFASFGITCQVAQHKALLFGIAGALIFRALFVFLGAGAFNLHWSVEVAFGLAVAYSAYLMQKNMNADEDEEVNYADHKGVKFLSKFYPVSDKLNGDKFFIIENGKKFATPLLACLVVIELSDVMFAFDSVPAVIAVTKEELLVYSAMMLAVMGLRALYFVMVAMMDKLPDLDKAVIAVLYIVAGKLVAGAFGYHMPAWVMTSIIITLFSATFIKAKVNR